jgi:hypothetical protein
MSADPAALATPPLHSARSARDDVRKHVLGQRGRAFFSLSAHRALSVIGAIMGI